MKCSGKGVDIVKNERSFKNISSDPSTKSSEESAPRRAFSMWKPGLDLEITNRNHNIPKEVADRIKVVQKEQTDRMLREQRSQSDENLNTCTTNKEGDQIEISKADSEPTLYSTGGTTDKKSKWRKIILKKVIKPARKFSGRLRRTFSKAETENTDDPNLNIEKNKIH